MGKLIINGNQLYEIDEECIRNKLKNEKNYKSQDLKIPQNSNGESGKDERKKQQ